MSLKNKAEQLVKQSTQEFKNVQKKAKEYLKNIKIKKQDNILSKESFKALLLVSLSGFDTSLIDNNASQIHYTKQNLENQVKIKGKEANTFSEYQKPDESEKNSNSIEQEDRPIMLNYLVIQALTNTNFDFEIQVKILAEIREIIGENNKISTPEEKVEIEKKVEEKIKKHLPKITIEDVNSLPDNKEANYKFTKEEIDEVLNEIVKEKVREIMKLLQKD